MNFKYHFLSQIYKESMQCELSKDPHMRLNTFERKLRAYLMAVKLDPEFLQAAAMMLKLINKAQDNVTEKITGIDIDGDGIVGPATKEEYEVITEFGVIKEDYHG